MFTSLDFPFEVATVTVPDEFGREQSKPHAESACYPLTYHKTIERLEVISNT
jgi:hypothetical protein